MTLYKLFDWYLTSVPMFWTTLLIGGAWLFWKFICWIADEWSPEK